MDQLWTLLDPLSGQLWARQGAHATMVLNRGGVGRS